MSDIQKLQLELFALRGQLRVIEQKVEQLKRKREPKRCKRCDEMMDADQFYADDRYRDGKYPYCRECKRRYYQSKKKAA